LKPDPEIYHRLLRRNGLDAAGCLFIDDSPANVAAAIGVGMKAVRFTAPEALRADLQRFGVVPV
jgi:2-haloacid dehalogenase